MNYEEINSKSDSFVIVNILKTPIPCKIAKILTNSFNFIEAYISICYVKCGNIKKIIDEDQDTCSNYFIPCIKLLELG